MKRRLFIKSLATAVASCLLPASPRAVADQNILDAVGFNSYPIFSKKEPLLVSVIGVGPEINKFMYYLDDSGIEDVNYSFLTLNRTSNFDEQIWQHTLPGEFNNQYHDNTQRYVENISGLSQFSLASSFGREQLIVFVADMSDQDSRKIVHDLVVNAKESDVYMLVALCFQPSSFTYENGINDVHISVVSMQGCAGSNLDIVNNLIGPTSRITTSSNHPKQGFPSRPVISTRFLKSRAVIEIISDLVHNKSIYGADIADFMQFFAGTESQVIHVSTWYVESHNEGALISENLLNDIQVIETGRYVVPTRAILHIVTGSNAEQVKVDEIISCVSSRLDDNCLYQVMWKRSDLMSRDKIRVSLIAA